MLPQSAISNIYNLPYNFQNTFRENHNPECLFRIKPLNTFKAIVPMTLGIILVSNDIPEKNDRRRYSSMKRPT